MEKKVFRIVYMGTPEFAVESLRRLVENGYQVVGVVTMPDKPAGRGHKVQYSPVKQYALENNLPLLQPEKLKDETFLEELRAWKADLQIVVAFRMLPEAVWSMPRFGTFNLHASLLPQYRGAAPINWAVINGETETGVTTFFLDREIDTGEIIKQVKVPIADTDHAGIVHDKLMVIGAELVLETVNSILEGNARPVPQEKLIPSSDLRPAPKIFKDTCRIDWKKSVKSIYDFIRGLSPYPAAWTELCPPEGESVVMKIFETKKINNIPSALSQNETFAIDFIPGNKNNFPVNAEKEGNEYKCRNTDSCGKIYTDGKTYLYVAAADGLLSIEVLQLPGKKRLRIDEFLRGFRLTNNFNLR